MIQKINKGKKTKTRVASAPFSEEAALQFSLEYSKILPFKNQKKLITFIHNLC